MRFLLALILALTVLSAAATAGGRRHRTAHQPPPPFGPQVLQGGPYTQMDLYRAAAYPKYYGGFHSRALQNTGIPTGDIGLRNYGGIGAMPW
jgi:hypothetical protein